MLMSHWILIPLVLVPIHCQLVRFEENDEMEETEAIESTESEVPKVVLNEIYQYQVHK